MYIGWPMAPADSCIANTNDLVRPACRRSARSKISTNLLGYTPPDTPEGSCHLLKVKMEPRRIHGCGRRSGYCNVKQVDLLAGQPARARPGNARSRRYPRHHPVPQPCRRHSFISPPTPRVSTLHWRSLPIPSSSRKVKGHQHADVNILGIAYGPNGAVGAPVSATSVKLDFADKKELEAFLKKALSAL